MNCLMTIDSIIYWTFMELQIIPVCPVSRIDATFYASFESSPMYDNTEMKKKNNTGTDLTKTKKKKKRKEKNLRENIFALKSETLD